MSLAAWLAAVAIAAGKESANSCKASLLDSGCPFFLVFNGVHLLECGREGIGGRQHKLGIDRSQGLGTGSGPFDLGAQLHHEQGVAEGDVANADDAALRVPVDVFGPVAQGSFGGRQNAEQATEPIPWPPDETARKGPNCPGAGTARRRGGPC